MTTKNKGRNRANGATFKQLCVWRDYEPKKNLAKAEVRPKRLARCLALRRTSL